MMSHMVAVSFLVYVACASFLPPTPKMQRRLLRPSRLCLILTRCASSCVCRGSGPDGRGVGGRRQQLAPGRGAGVRAGEGLSVAGRLLQLVQPPQLHVLQGTCCAARLVPSWDDCLEEDSFVNRPNVLRSPERCEPTTASQSTLVRLVD